MSTTPTEKTLNNVRAAIRELETALSSQPIDASIDAVVCIAQGRLMTALEATKEALASLEDVL